MVGKNVSNAACSEHRECGMRCFQMLDTHLQFKVVPYQFLLLSSEVLQLGLIVADLLPHHARRVAPEPLPFSRQFSALLSVIIKKTAEVPQLLVILRQPCVQVFQATDLVLKIRHLFVQFTDNDTIF